MIGNFHGIVNYSNIKLTPIKDSVHAMFMWVGVAFGQVGR